MRSLLIALALSAGLALQEIVHVRGGYAACEDRDTWATVYAARDTENQWYQTARKALSEGCWITSDSQAVRLHRTRHPEADQIQKAAKGDTTRYWIAREAVY